MSEKRQKNQEELAFSFARQGVKPGAGRKGPKAPDGA